MKKNLIGVTIISSILLLMLFQVTVSGATYNGLTYKIEKNEIIITDCSNSVTEVVIPEEISGYPVTQIKGAAFYGNKITSGGNS